MNFLTYIIWNFNPKIFPDGLFGLDIPIVWYGLLFALGFFFGQQILVYIFKKEGKPEKDVETLTVYMIIATVLGARLGHVFFYEPDRYLANPIEILQIWNGGLASHGAAFGILFSLWVYSRYDIHLKGIRPVFKKIRRPGQNFFQIVDRIVIVVALAGALIRLGNFTNSEIEGVPTGSDYGVVFIRNITENVKSVTPAITSIDYEKGNHLVPEGNVPVEMIITFDDKYNFTTEQVSNFVESRLSAILTEEEYFISGHINQPVNEPIRFNVSDNAKSATLLLNGISRHPAQLYESITTFLIFILLLLIWYRCKENTRPGLLLGLFLIILFGLRFVHEFYKENQVSFEDQMAYNMGQLLSIPLVIAGIFILIYALRHKAPADHQERVIHDK